MNSNLKNPPGKKKYPDVFSPISIGRITLPNRIFFPPWCFNWANADGTISEKLMDYYVDLAEGGAGLIITGAAAVSPDSLLYERSMRIWNKTHRDSLRTLVEEIEKRGSVVAIQLMNFGRQSVTTFTGLPVYGPSAIPCPVKSKKDPNYRIREMTLDDIYRVKNDFVNAAILSAEAGVKVIQLHAAHGFLLNEFISPYSNFRTDSYGGSPENRLRFVVEIIREIKKELGDSIVLDIRLSVDELVKTGLKPDDFEFILPALEEAGVDMFNISVSVSETTGRVFRGKLEPQGRYAYLAEKMREYTELRIAHALFIGDLANANEILKNKRIDLIGMGRAQFADPYLVKKTFEGREGDIVKCAWDNACLFSFAGKGENYVHCIRNPKYKRKSVE